jgi:NAD(P)-dependent dehydrogenase (short-subunit alcohol dehydrogenase family)
MTDKTLVLVTGGNQGLGYYAIQQLSATGKYHILMGSRDFDKAKAAIKTLTDDASAKANPANVEPIQINVQSDESIEAAAKTVEQKYGRLDILMVNAGIAYPPGDNLSKRQQYQQIYDTNVFGAAATVDAFIPLLRKSTAPGGKRIAFTSSGTSSLQWALELQGPISAVNFPIYRSSKTAESMVMVHYARLLEEEGFVVGASDPGHCGTNLNNFKGAKDPRLGAKVLIKAATEAKENVHGRVINEDGFEPW